MRLGGLLATAALLALASSTGALRAAGARRASIRPGSKRQPATRTTGSAYGRTYAEQRFSPLDDINDDNVGQLGLAWAVELDTSRGQEATPLVVDGVMYVTTAWSKVMALDAATGKVLWRYDPQPIGSQGRARLLRRGEPRRRGMEGQGLSSARSTGG